MVVTGPVAISLRVMALEPLRPVVAEQLDWMEGADCAVAAGK